MSSTATQEDRIARLEELVQLLQGAEGKLLAILQNRNELVAAAGAVVGGGGTITPDVSITTVAVNAKIRISANFGGQPTAGATCAPFLQIKVGGGAFVTQYSWPAATGVANDPIGYPCVFEFDATAPAGTVVTVHWQTSPGDGNITLGNVAAGGFGAVLLVEERP